MNQTIIVIAIIAIVAAYVVFSFVKNLRTKSDGECGGCCTCSARNEIKTAIDKKNKTAA